MAKRQSPVASAPPAISPARAALFSAIALLLPFAFLALLEAGLRVGGYARDEALFIPAPFDSARYLVPNPRYARRFFPGDPSAPTPPSDAFLAKKPAGSLRVFVLGESTTAGFPFPANGTFSRVLADMLRDALPARPIEVVNIGIPATNTFALLAEAPEVIAQHPDAVLIYAGHNEYYGALGSASTVRIAGAPGLVRLVIRLERLRTVRLIERGLASLRGRFAPRPADEPSISRMEELANRDTLRLGGDGYARGVRQFDGNLQRLLSTFRNAGIPVYVGSLASNIRDRAPFASDTGTAQTSANAAFTIAHVALDAHDVTAESLFTRAKDLDLIRFRAPSEFNRVIRDDAARGSATYVPVYEGLRAAAVDHIPGNEIFFEHVHPRPIGEAIIARLFFTSLAGTALLGQRIDTTKIPPADAYARRMTLTALDQRIADVITGALVHRWPFVPRDSGSTFLQAFVAKDLTDSLALAVVSGNQTWVQAKLALAARLESMRDFTGAVAEYQGLMRDQPWNESPFRFAARALLAANRPAEAQPLLARAYEIQPTAYTCLALARFAAADSARLPIAAMLLQQSMRLGGFSAEAMFQLSLVYARQGNVDGARAAAGAVFRAAPNYPGLRQWMSLLKM